MEALLHFLLPLSIICGEQENRIFMRRTLIPPHMELTSEDTYT